MSKFLIAYATTHGHTAKIARRIADAIRAAGHAVDMRGDLAESDPSPVGYDAVIAGASIHAGRHQDEMVRWARGHGASLNMMPSAFFSVSLTAAEDTDEARATTRGYLDEFEEATGWTPRQRTAFAGAVQYREYGFFMRLFMRALMKRARRPTDTRRDHVYTDWNAVDEFARACTAMAVGAAA